MTLIGGFLLVATFFLLRGDGAVVAKSATKLFFVPSSARAGHVVAALPYRQGQLSRVLSSDNDVSVNSFAVLNTGELIITSDVSVLGGRSVHLTIQHRLPSEAWLETVQVHIHDASPRIHFRNPPYVGRVEENKPVGSAVNGLQAMADSVRDLPYGCQLSFVASTDATSFRVARANGAATIVTATALDRERKDAYHVTVRALCQNGDEASAIITIRVLDVNDNAPQFDAQVYRGNVALDAAALTPIMRISATDADSGDTLRYGLRETAAPFGIDSITGELHVKSSEELLWKTYELKAIATDGAGHESAPVLVRVEVHSPIEDSASNPPVLVRHRRDAVRKERVFVVRLSETGELFSVAASSDERYQLTDADAAMGLTLSATGMVSRGASHQWNGSVDDFEFSFSINVTNVGDTAYQSTLPVKVYVMRRDDYDRIFSNTPYPLWTTVPQWIRPDTVIYTVHAIDADKAEVQYKLESGGDDRFTVDVTGAVKVAGRKMFELDTTYRLAISAQVVGSAKKKFTPAQVLSIKVEDKAPQFEQNPYIKEMSEFSTSGHKVIQINAKSFQEIDIEYSLAAETTADSATDLPFVVDRNLGWLTLTRQLKYISDPHQYRMVVTAREPASGIESKVLVIVNLKPENLHAPYFALDVYVARNVPENIETTKAILTVTAIDLDYGQNGNLTFNSSNDNFTVTSTDGKHGVVYATRQLDYDFQPLHMYEFTITATDNGINPKSGSTTVRIWMENMNDEAPVFDPQKQLMQVKEFSKKDLLVHIIQAYDPDGDEITFKFTERPSSTDTDTKQGPFNLDPRTGFISLAKDLKRGTPNHVLSITAMDGTKFETVGSVDVRIIGVNHPPQFKECPPVGVVPMVKENMEVNSNVTELFGIDDDSGSNGEVVFSVVSYKHINPTKYFEVEQYGKTAYLKTLVIFDREKPLDQALLIGGQVKYKVTVKIEDRGTPQNLSTYCFFFVVIKDDNDNHPMFDEESYETTIRDNTLLHSRVLRVFAIDDDEGKNAEVEYTIQKQDANCLNCLDIDKKTGWITVQNDISSQNRLTLTVNASDKAEPPTERKSSTVQVTIIVTDKDSELPTKWDRPRIDVEWIDDITDLKLLENVSVNTPLTQSFHARYKNIDPLVYLLVEGRTPQENKAGKYFRFPQVIKGGNMTIKNRQQLDYETVPNFSLKLRASGTMTVGKKSDARLRVQLIDVNDEYPKFVGLDEDGKYTAAVSGTTQKDDYVLRVKAIDLDGTSPNNKVTYSWAENCPDCKNFTLNGATGNITAAQKYERSSKSQYQLNVVVKDGAPSAFRTDDLPNSETKVVIVMVMGDSKNPPYFDQQLYNLSVTEGSPYGYTIGFVRATRNADNNVTQYSFVEGNEDHMFGLNHSDGRIFVMRELRYIQKSSYRLKYRVFDGGAQSNYTYVDVRVQPANLYPPVFEQRPYTISGVEEEDQSITSSNKKLLTTVSATDPDESGSGTASLRYSLAGHYTRQHPGTFSIEADDKVYLKRGLDRDYPSGHANWQINVVATSSSGKSGYGVLNLKLIDKNDNTPVFDTCCIEGSVDEHSLPGTPVLKVTATDVDAGVNAQVKYEMVDSPKSPTDTDLFRIGITDGQVATNVGRAVLDREVQDQYKVIVRAYDGGIPRHEVNQTLNIAITDVNDKYPIFVQPKSYTVEIPEEMLAGMPVSVVTATDADIGKNAELTYTIKSGDGDHFYMDSIFVTGTGVVRIKKPIDFDQSTSHSFTFTVKVEDPDPSHTDTATVTVNVYDINDNAPVFTPVKLSVSKPEDLPVNTLITTFTAVDKDEGINAQFEYFIDYRNTDKDKKFKIDKSTGEVKLRNKLDRETQAEHSVHVLAIDKGVPPQTGTATLFVTVTDVNDNAPELREHYNFVVEQTTRKGALVGIVKASDRDTAVNGPPFTLQVSCNKPECKDFTFTSIPDTTGKGEDQITVKANRTGYKRETLNRDRYLIPIVIHDNPTSKEPKLTSTGTLTITVESSNDNQHAPGEKFVTIYNYKRGFKNVNLGKVFDEDVDDMENPGKTYEFIGDHEDFKLDSNTGELTMLQVVPKGEHQFKVKVSDSVWKEVISSVTVNVVYLEEEQVKSSGSIRLSGITGKEFIRKPKKSDGLYEASKYDKLRTKLASLLSTDEANVHIFTVNDITDTKSKEKVLDIMFVAHGSPWYRPARLNGLVWSNKDKVEDAVGVTIVSSPINECLNKQCWDSGCTNELTTLDKPLVVDSGKTSLIGVTASYVATCECGATTFSEKSSSCGANTCLNGGNCTDTWSGYNCTCPEGFSGPRCQQMKLSFSGNGWAWFEPLSQCEEGKTSFEFLTLKGDTLLLYNGPMNNNDAHDFISVELVGGHPTLRVDLGEGEIKLQAKGQRLDDGKWHSLEIFKNNRMFRLVVDHCRDSLIDENIANSTEDRITCEAQGEVAGEHFLLNVNTPLQLGGRSVPSASYPARLEGSYMGCIKNLRHNGLLYDLHIGEVGESKNTKDGCLLEQDSCSGCPGNSTCVGSLGKDHTCVCNPGLRGDLCDEETMVKDFYQDKSFIEWQLKPAFNASLLSRHFEIQIMFRTRQHNGMVFSAASFSTLERLQLKIVENHLQFVCDLGSGDEVLSLNYVNVSDGQWHIVRIGQYGNQLILRLDGGEGKHYAESPPRKEHRLISLSDKHLFGAADVKYKKYVDSPTRTSDLVDSCVKDIRYNSEWFPMDASENAASTAARVYKLQGARTGCPTAACGSVNCPAPQLCFDVWREHQCWCPYGQMVAPAPKFCVDIVDCSIKRCDNGDCVIRDGHWHCNCDKGWFGPTCSSEEPEEPAPVTARASLGMILIVVFSLIGLLIIILAVVVIGRRRKPDLLLGVDPEDDIRENVGYYDEEGAGEEDMHAYDLSRLQKPMDGDTDSMIKPPLDNLAFQPEIPRTGPEPMTDRPPIMPGDNPNIGNFIDDRMKDADDDPNAPPYDSLHEYDYEGNNSEAGTLSSLQSSSSGDQDFDYLNDFGPRFQKLADLYGGGDSDDENEENASSV